MSSKHARSGRLVALRVRRLLCLFNIDLGGRFAATCAQDQERAHGDAREGTRGVRRAELEGCAASIGASVGLGVDLRAVVAVAAGRLAERAELERRRRVDSPGRLGSELLGDDRGRGSDFLERREAGDVERPVGLVQKRVRFVCGTMSWARAWRISSSFKARTRRQARMEVRMRACAAAQRNGRGLLAKRTIVELTC
jgi:hypothetical protein